QDMKLPVMLVYMSELYDGGSRLSSLCHIFFSYLRVVNVVILKTFFGVSVRRKQPQIAKEK
ncbi:MAG: hypothetical protein IKG19_05310, partial [Lachnospiraceae bacterium]|nr:hypothetical protein [Lachnospiraceae bacterium]